MFFPEFTKCLGVSSTESFLAGRKPQNRILDLGDLVMCQLFPAKGL